MARLIWSPQSITDLQAICEFVGRDSPEYACALAQRIVDVADSIALFPRSGRIVPEIGISSLRERIVGSYRVIYRVKPEAVEIATILHGARNLRG
jgi:toxin ParE1/3/4